MNAVILYSLIFSPITSAIYLLGLPVILPKHFLKCLLQFTSNIWSYNPTMEIIDHSEIGTLLAKINKRVKHAQHHGAKYVPGRGLPENKSHISYRLVIS